MTKELFREDSYVTDCDAIVTQVDNRGIQLNSTVFYPEGGGQPGDTGTIEFPDGSVARVINTIKDRESSELIHVLEETAPQQIIGNPVIVRIDWERRYRMMRMHSAMHVLCSIVEGGVTGGQVGENKSRLDFDLPDISLGRDNIQNEIDRIIDEDHKIQHRWITDEEMKSNANLIRTMSVKPPIGTGTVRLLEIDGVDLQPCGGTHVAGTKEIGCLKVGKIENKGKHNRRINLHLED